MSYHDSESKYGEPWPHPQKTYERVRLENTGWTRLQLSIPAKEASDGCFEGVSQANGAEATDSLQQPAAAAPSGSGDADEKQTPRPPRHDIFVRFVGDQNQTEHLQTLDLGRSAVGRTHNGRISPTNQGDTGGPAQSILPQPSQPLAAQRLQQYSASFMNRAIAMAGSSQGAGVLGQPSSPHRRYAFPAPTTSQPSFAAAFETWQSITASILPLFDASVLLQSSLEVASGDASDYVHGARRGASSSLPSLSIEDMNALVSAHTRRLTERGSARAGSILAGDLRQLLMIGMKRLSAVPSISTTQTTSADSERQDQQRTLTRLAEIWTAFLCHMLPWIEAAFITLNSDPALAVSSPACAIASGSSSSTPVLQQADLYGDAPSSGVLNSPAGNSSYLSSPRPPQKPLSSPPHHDTGLPSSAGYTASSSRTHANGNGNASPQQSHTINVRKLAFATVRDVVVLPHFERYFELFSRIGSLQTSTASEPVERPGHGDAQGPSTSSESPMPNVVRRLTQMLHLLRSVQSGDDAQRAIEALLRALRAGCCIPGNAAGTEASAGYAGGGGGSVPGQTNTGLLRLSNGSRRSKVKGLGIPSSQSGGSYNSSYNPAFTLGGQFDGIQAFPSSTTLASSTDKASNRKGWIPRSTAKHGVLASVHSGNVSPSADVQPLPEGSSDDSVQRRLEDISRRRPAAMMMGDEEGAARHEAAYLEALKEAGRRSGNTASGGSGADEGGGRRDQAGHFSSEPSASLFQQSGTTENSADLGLPSGLSSRATDHTGGGGDGDGDDDLQTPTQDARERF